MSKGRDGQSKNLTERDEFQFISELVFKHSTADHTLLSLHDGETGTSRFANSEIVQNVNVRRTTLTVSTAFGQQHGTASTTDLSVGSIQDVLRRAEVSAKASPSDPEYLPPLGIQAPSTHRSWSQDTADSGPEGRVKQTNHILQLCQQQKLLAAGTVTTTANTIGVASSTGLMSFEPRTEAAFSVTAIGESGSGWASNRHRSLDALEISIRTEQAIDKAKLAANPELLAPGRFTVILEPPAVAGLVSRLVWELSARTYYKNTSALSGKLGEKICDSRLTLRNDPTHPALLGNGFNGEGLPAGKCTWIDQGKLTHLCYDRYTAQVHQVNPSPEADAPILSCGPGQPEPGNTIEDLVKETRYGILVTNFWYIRSVNPTDLTLTGMTRDGTFLIENGQVTKPVRNFRFHESPLQSFQRLVGMTNPKEASSHEAGKMLVPALKLDDFNFSSVTKF